MTKRRARLNDDNDPLSSTDKVLAGFEQISKSASQQDEVSTSKEVDLSTSQPDKLLTSQKSDKSASQQDEVSTSKEADLLTSQQSKSEHTFEASTSQQNNTPIIQLNGSIPNVQK